MTGPCWCYPPGKHSKSRSAEVFFGGKRMTADSELASNSSPPRRDFGAWNLTSHQQAAQRLNGAAVRSRRQLAAVFSVKAKQIISKAIKPPQPRHRSAA